MFKNQNMFVNSSGSIIVNIIIKQNIKFLRRLGLVEKHGDMFGGANKLLRFES